MNTIKQTYVIAATPEEVWRALTHPELIQEWSGASAQYSPEAGAPYSLWDGDIVGEIVEVVPGARLVQTWKPTDWTRLDSVVRITLVPQEGTTLVDLVHENVEESDYDGTNEGWDIYYLGAIKRMLEARGAGSGESKRKAATAKTPKAQAARKRTAGSRAAPKRATQNKTRKTAAKSAKRAARGSKRRSKG